MKIKFVYVLLVLILSAKSMHAQEKKAGKIVSDYFALLDAGNLDAVGNLLTDDFQAIAPFSPKPFVKTAWKAVGQTLKAAYPDMKHAITYWFADDNWVAVRGHWSRSRCSCRLVRCHCRSRSWCGQGTRHGNRHSPTRCRCAGRSCCPRCSAGWRFGAAAWRARPGCCRRCAGGHQCFRTAR